MRDKWPCRFVRVSGVDQPPHLPRVLPDSHGPPHEAAGGRRDVPGHVQWPRQPHLHHWGSEAPGVGPLVPQHHQGKHSQWTPRNTETASLPLYLRFLGEIRIENETLANVPREKSDPRFLTNWHASRVSEIILCLVNVEGQSGCSLCSRLDCSPLHRPAVWLNCSLNFHSIQVIWTAVVLVFTCHSKNQRIIWLRV